MELIPVSILTGFLGSGKTTLLNRLLKHPDLQDTAVIINEFGEVAIDHLLVEQAKDGIVELSDGCICCTIRGELVDTLVDLIERRRSGETGAFRRIVVETTGLADPAPILHAIMAHPVLLQALRLDGVIATIDAVNGSSTLDRHEEAVKQVAVADRIVLTKLDLAEGANSGRPLRSRLEALNSGADTVDALDRNFSPEWLFETGLHNPQTQSADVDRWLKLKTPEAGTRHHHHAGGSHHDDRIRSFSLVHDRPIALTALETFFDLLQSGQGERLLRMKGIVRLAEDPDRPMVIHAVQNVFHPAGRLPGWPGPDRRSRLVLITIDMDEDYVRRLFDAFVGKPSIDTPDRTALEDNPLAVPGLTF